nr:uncharacterized protein LOC111420114 [Onthophagus taurus]
MALERSKSIEADIHQLSVAVGEGMQPNQEKDGDEENKLSVFEKVRLIFTNITVEPIMVCYILPSVMASLTIQNLNLEKACRVNLHYNDTICDALTSRNSSGYDVTHEQTVQKLVASMNAWKNIIQSLLPSILLMFIGSWSDRNNRRKPCIILPVVGELISCIGFLICTYFFYQLSMEYCALSESVPPSLTGGWFCMYMGVFSYISSVSTKEMRTLRIGAVSLFSNACFTIGTALSGFLYRQIGFYGVFFLAAGIYTIGLLYGGFRLKEIKVDENQVDNLEKNELNRDVIKVENGKKKNFFADFFDLKHISETFKVAFKTGSKSRKKRICVIMVLVMVIIGPLHGEFNVMYLFVRYRFGWDEVDYALYSTFNIIFHMIGTLFSLTFFSKFLKFDDALLGVISSMSKVISAVVYAFAPSPFYFYLGAIAEMLNGTSFIAMRSITSKLVPPEELGKINSLFGVSEALMPLVYGPMYSLVYRTTIKIFPGSFLLLGGLLTLPAVFIFLWLYREHKRDELEEELNKKLSEKLLTK